MDWLEDVRSRAKRKNQILFSQNNPLIQELQRVIDGLSHRTMVLWAFEFAEETVQTLRERYPEEQRPQQAVELAKAWASGKVKMPVAQRAILDAHAFAKEITSTEDIALCHAVGQACGVVHATGHAAGFPIYDLTAIVRRCGVDRCKQAVEQRADEYIERMHYWEKNTDSFQGEWADFLMADK